MTKNEPHFKEHLVRGAKKFSSEVFIYKYVNDWFSFIQRGSDNAGWQQEQKRKKETGFDVVGECLDTIRERAKLLCSAHLNDLEIFLENN